MVILFFYLVHKRRVLLIAGLAEKEFKTKINFFEPITARIQPYIDLVESLIEENLKIIYYILKEHIKLSRSKF